MRRCAYSREQVADTMAILVGSIERGSAAPALVYACCTCVAILKLMPLSKHPADSDGHPRRADGTPVLASGPSPVRVTYGERAS